MLSRSLWCPTWLSTRYFAKRYLGFGITLFLLISCNLITVVRLHLIVLFDNPAWYDICLTVLFAVLLPLTFLTFGLCSFVNPGRTPAWLAESRVEGFVRSLLLELLRLRNGEASSDQCCLRSAQQLAVNEALAQFKDRWCCTEGSTSVVVNDSDADELDEHENLLTHSQRGSQTSSTLNGVRRRDSPRTMNLRATYMEKFMCVVSEALGALDSTPENFQQEMSFLLGGARWCRFCLLYKLEETHHCSTCGSCIYHMDHHCPWIGQCVGRGNRKFFLLFVGNLALLSTVIVVHVVCASRTHRIDILAHKGSVLLLISFIICVSTAAVMALFLAFELQGLSRGQSKLRVMLQERRRTPGSLRRGKYSKLASRGANGTNHRSTLDNLRLVFGVGDVFPCWLLPTYPQWPPLEELEVKFWEELGETVLRQVRYVVDKELEECAPSGA